MKRNVHVLIVVEDGVKVHGAVYARHEEMKDGLREFIIEAVTPDNTGPWSEMTLSFVLAFVTDDDRDEDDNVAWRQAVEGEGILDLAEWWMGLSENHKIVMAEVLNLT